MHECRLEKTDERPWIERGAILLTHCAAQLTHRWLPPPLTVPLDDLFFASALEAEAHLVNRWRAFLRWAAGDGAGAFPWLSEYRRLRDPTLGQLLAAVTTHLAQMQAAGGNLVLWGDADYPALLSETTDPPLAISCLGDLSLLARPMTAVIGSRKATRLALEQSFAIGRSLAAAGRVVVSGGALGCDIAAHAGALATPSSPVPAIAVMAGGLARLYPDANDRYFRQLRARGALFISERLWNAPARPIDFPARNRIISGLCRTTVVMQAARRSGAMITARQALDQGRDVFVLGHPPGDVRAAGGQALIADGAESFGDAVGYLELQT